MSIWQTGGGSCVHGAPTTARKAALCVTRNDGQAVLTLAAAPRPQLLHLPVALWARDHRRPISPKSTSAGHSRPFGPDDLLSTLARGRAPSTPTARSAARSAYNAVGSRVRGRSRLRRAGRFCLAAISTRSAPRPFTASWSFRPQPSRIRARDQRRPFERVMKSRLMRSESRLAFSFCTARAHHDSPSKRRGDACSWRDFLPESVAGLSQDPNRRRCRDMQNLLGRPGAFRDQDRARGSHGGSPARRDPDTRPRVAHHAEAAQRST